MNRQSHHIEHGQESSPYLRFTNHRMLIGSPRDYDAGKQSQEWRIHLSFLVIPCVILELRCLVACASTRGDKDITEYIGS